MEYPGIDKPDTIDHGPKNGFNCSASLGMIYQAMGVHSAVINGRKQIDYIDRHEMVCKDLACTCLTRCLRLMHKQMFHVSVPKDVSDGLKPFVSA